MARARYQITPKDALSSWRWIRNKPNDYTMLDQDKAYQAEQSFKALQERWEAQEALNAWAEKWLNHAQWTQLKNAVRAQRKRDRVSLDKKPIAITLTPKAHLFLSSIAKHDNVTLSKVIEERLHAIYMELLRG